MRHFAIMIVLLLSGCLFQKNVPEITVNVDDPPEELIVSDRYEFSLTLTNEGDAPALNIKIESNIPALLSFETEEMAKIDEGFTRKVKAFIEAKDVLKEKESDSIEALIKVKYFDSEENQKTAKTSFTFTVRKPRLKIEKVEAGLLPGKVSAKENEEVPLTVYVKNEEERRMQDLFILFCSDYEYVTVYRVDITRVKNCFEYPIQDILWLNDILAKGFTLEGSLPTGARKVSFVLHVKLVWRTNGYDVVLDTKELRIDISAA